NKAPLALITVINGRTAENSAHSYTSITYEPALPYNWAWIESRGNQLANCTVNEEKAAEDDSLTYDGPFTQYHWWAFADQARENATYVRPARNHVVQWKEDSGLSVDRS